MPAAKQAAPVEPVVDHVFYQQQVAANDRVPLAGLLHSQPELLAKQLTVQEWDGLLTEFLQSTPD
jgi:hypothetical protein